MMNLYPASQAVSHRRLNHLEKIVIYGCIGLIIEVFFTGIASAFDGNIILKGTTYLWMLPVWSSGVYALKYTGKLVGRYNFFTRGFVYAVVCLLVEYLFGIYFLLVLKQVPWDYSYADWNIHGIIRLDYIPFWFCVGLASEKVVSLINRLHIRIGEEK